MSAYYNEIDRFPAAWLRNLVAAGHIASGEVDERSIAELDPADLAGVTQFHAFAGIGVWSYALRLAGWPDDREVWTGSCPCPSFSTAGKGRGFADPRHLWPEWFRLIRECRPGVVFGEQVEGAVKHGWLDLVCRDLEGEGYAVGACVLGAHSVRAPHLRQRLYFVAESESRPGWSHPRAVRGGPFARLPDSAGQDERRPIIEAGRSGDSRAVGLVAESDARRRERVGGSGAEETSGIAECRAVDLVADTDGAGRQGRDSAELCERAGQRALGTGGASGATRAVGHADRAECASRDGESRRIGTRSEQPAHPSDLNPWSDLVWLPCRDGKARPTESRLLPLADGPADLLGYVRDGDRLALSPLIEQTRNRVGRLRGYGNAIVAPLAAEFIRAYLDTLAS